MGEITCQLCFKRSQETGKSLEKSTAQRCTLVYRKYSLRWRGCDLCFRNSRAQDTDNKCGLHKPKGMKFKKKKKLAKKTSCYSTSVPELRKAAVTICHALLVMIETPQTSLRGVPENKLYPFAHIKNTERASGELPSWELLLFPARGSSTSFNGEYKLLVLVVNGWCLLRRQAP